MFQTLKEKLQAFIIVHHPDLMDRMEETQSLQTYMDDLVSQVMPKVLDWLSEEKPTYMIEELALKDLFHRLGPSRYDYILDILEKEFAPDYHKFFDIGVLRYEALNIITYCSEVFEAFSFSEETQDDRFLGYAIIAKVHEYLN